MANPLEVLERLEYLGFKPNILRFGDDRLWIVCDDDFKWHSATLFNQKILQIWPRCLTTPTHGDDVIVSWRQNVMRRSLQIVIHDNAEVECDIDEYNPRQAAFMHLMVDLIWGKVKKLWSKKK